MGKRACQYTTTSNVDDRLGTRLHARPTLVSADAMQTHLFADDQHLTTAGQKIEGRLLL